MRAILICMIILAAVNSAISATRNEEILYQIKLKAYGKYALQDPTEQDRILAMNVNTICPGSGSKAPAVLKQTFDCWERIDMENETLCDAVRNHAENCFKPIKEGLEKCLPERSKNIPDLLIKSVLNGFNYICTANTEHVLELTNTCFQTDSRESARCMRQLDSITEKERALTREDICEYGKIARGCIQAHLSAFCTQIKTRESFMGLIDALLFQCNDTIAAK